MFNLVAYISSSST